MKVENFFIRAVHCCFVNKAFNGIVEGILWPVVNHHSLLFTPYTLAKIFKHSSISIHKYK